MKKIQLFVLLLCLIALMGAGLWLKKQALLSKSSPTAQAPVQAPIQVPLPPAALSDQTPSALAEKDSVVPAAITDEATAKETVSAKPAWQDTPCQPLPLPEHTHQGLLCKTNQTSFCAIFPNGKPFFCQETTAQGKTTYQSNQWGSSATVSHYQPDGKILSLYYFAYGELKREEEHNYPQNLITRIWWDEHQTRLYQSNTQGRTLNKFYFRPNQPFIQYPDGNDMGEINGTWHREGNRFFIDGQFLYELPQRMTAPDICRIFDGACTFVPTEA